MVMTLSRLAAAVRDGRVVGSDVTVSGIALDSRKVAPGDLFAALPGAQADGRRFIDDALARGASALLVARRGDAPPDVPLLVADDARSAAARCAHALAGNPAADLELIGVTGTNGKTTTAWLLQALLAETADTFGCLGTVSFRTGGETHASTHTTPDPVTLARLLAQIRAAGGVGATLEVSSHALAQDRISGLTLSGAVFTNLTRDHLDYHGTMEAYRVAKLRLLGYLGEGAPVVFPSDDPWLAPTLRGTPRAIGFGSQPAADVRLLSASYAPDGTDLTLATPEGALELRSPLLGPFNASNVVAAVALALALGRTPEQLRRRLRRFGGVPGRLQRVATDDGPMVIVDYAHTPDAVEKALDACRCFCGGRLVAVVGAGGDRDPGKRPQMGRAAQLHADAVVLTSDNPRTEDPERILDDVAAGMAGSGRPWRREVDRARAIELAIADGRAGDCVAILGKGHEDYQEINGVRHPFSDAEVARSMLGGAADA